LTDKETPIGRYKRPYNNQANTLAQTFDGLIQVTVLPPRILDAVLKLVYVSYVVIQSAYSVFLVKSFYSVCVFGLRILCGSSIRLDRLGRWLVLGLNLVRFALSLSMYQLCAELF